MTVHTWFRPGQRVMVILKDGRHIVSRFIEYKCKRFITRKGTYKTSDIRSTTIYRADVAQHKRKEKCNGK